MPHYVWYVRTLCCPLELSRETDFIVGGGGGGEGEGGGGHVRFRV